MAALVKEAAISTPRTVIKVAMLGPAKLAGSGPSGASTVTRTACTSSSRSRRMAPTRIRGGPTVPRTEGGKGLRIKVSMAEPVIFIGAIDLARSIKSGTGAISRHHGLLGRGRGFASITGIGLTGHGLAVQGTGQVEGRLGPVSAEVDIGKVLGGAQDGRTAGLFTGQAYGSPLIDGACGGVDLRSAIGPERSAGADGAAGRGSRLVRRAIVTLSPRTSCRLSSGGCPMETWAVSMSSFSPADSKRGLFMRRVVGFSRFTVGRGGRGTGRALTHLGGPLISISS